MPPDARHRLVAAVVDAVDEAGEAQHVFGHALPPLAARGGARQRLPERLRGVGQHLGLTAGLAELAGQLADVLPPVALDLFHQAVQARELVAHRPDLVVDRALGAPQLLGAAAPLGVEHLAVHAQELLDRQLGRGAGSATGRPSEARQHDRQASTTMPRSDDHQFHCCHGTTGV